MSLKAHHRVSLISTAYPDMLCSDEMDKNTVATANELYFNSSQVLSIDPFGITTKFHNQQELVARAIVVFMTVRLAKLQISDI